MKAELTDDAKTYKIKIANFEAGGHDFILFNVELYASSLLLLTRAEAIALHEALCEAMLAMPEPKLSSTAQPKPIEP